MRKQLSAFLILTCFFLQAQKVDKQNSKITIRGSVGIPKTISSRMFHTCFNGIYEANVSGNVRLFSNFYVGLGYQNTFFQNNKQVFMFYTSSSPSKGTLISGALSYNTKLMDHAGYIKLGFDKFFSDHAYMSYAINSGLIYGQYMNVVVDSSAENMPFVAKNFIAPYIQPEASINVVVDKHLSFSFLLSYATLLYKYDPKAPEFAHFEVVKGKSNNYFISYLTLGIGFHVLLGNSKGIVVPAAPVNTTIEEDEK
jgi:hypothetical protein